MKKTIFSFCICLLSFFSFSQSWIEFVPAGATEPIVNVLRSDSLLVEFEVMVPGMYDTQIDTFNRVEIKGHTKLDSVGFPEVPVVSFLVAIPYCDSINLTINPLDSSLFSGYNIYPAPEFVKDTTPVKKTTTSGWNPRIAASAAPGVHPSIMASKTRISCREATVPDSMSKSTG